MINPPMLSELIAAGTDTMLAKLKRTKSRIEASTIISITDSLGREVQVFYRVIDACPSAQTDASGDCYSIEQVLYKQRRVRLSGCGEQELLEWLNSTNPAGVRFQYR